MTNLTNLDYRLVVDSSQPVNVYQAKTHLSQLIDRALAGEDVVIARNGRPMVRLVPVRVTGKRRMPGAWRGLVQVAEDFDDLPVELAAAFRGERA